MIIYSLLLATLLYFIFVKSRSYAAYLRLADQVGGPKGYPLLGNALDFLQNMESSLLTLSSYVKEHGTRFLFFFGPSPVLLLSSPEDIEKVCTSTDLIDKSLDYDVLKYWLGKGLLTSTGAHWQHRRKLLTPCFHFAILERFIGPINTHAQKLVEILEDKFVGDKTDSFQDICPYVARCALDIICETSMGIEMNAQLEQSSSYVDAIHRMGALFQHRQIRPWLRLSDFLWSMTAEGKEEQRCLEIIHGFTDKVIADRKRRSEDVATEQEDEEEVEGGRKVKKPLLDLLLEVQRADQDGISDAGIQEEITTFGFAGYDTVSVAVGFCLYSLGGSPKAQEKVHAELDSVFEGDTTRPLSSTDLKKLKYLELCFKESLRLFPSAPIIGRTTRTPFQLDEETMIPEGVEVYLFLFNMHRNGKFFHNAKKFIPERFDPESEEFARDKKENKSSFAYLPFSAGQRNCIGQRLAAIEAKVMLATILRRFRVVSEGSIDKLELRSEIVLRTKSGLQMKFEAR